MRKYFIFLLLSALIASGCGENMFEGMEDKETEEAQTLEGAREMDGGDYSTAMAECQSVNSDAEAIDCAAATMASVGFTADNIIEAMSDAEKSGNTGDLSYLGYMKLRITKDSLGDLEYAGKVLDARLRAHKTEPELNFQRSLISVIDVVITMGYYIDERKIGTPTDGISIKEAKQLANTIIKTVDAMVTRISFNIGRIASTLPHTEIAGEGIGQVLRDVTKTLDKNGNGIISNQEMIDYLLKEYGQ